MWFRYPDGCWHTQEKRLFVTDNYRIMKPFLFLCCMVFCFAAKAQRNFGTEPNVYDKLFDAKYMQKPPVYPFGPDSCKRFYFSHFRGFDSLLTRVIENGDTAKYIRVYFSFIIDKNGTPYDARFEKIAATRYARSEGAKTITYFFENKKYYENLIREMISKMTFWKPGLHNMVPVDSKVEDYIQFWVGLTPASG